MAVNGSGIRDTARVLKISPTTVIEELKKHRQLQLVNKTRLARLNSPPLEVVLLRVLDPEAELDQCGALYNQNSNSAGYGKQ